MGNWKKEIYLKKRIPQAVLLQKRTNIFSCFFKNKYKIIYLLVYWGFFLVTIFFTVLCICYIITNVRKNFSYPLSHIVITGNLNYTTDTDIYQLVFQLGKLKVVLLHDFSLIQEKIQLLPWIQKVSIRSQWPNTLKVHIVEYKPIARWNGVYRISTTGIIFKVYKTEDISCFGEKDLLIPELYGPDDSVQEALNYYYIFREILKYSNILIKSVKLDMRHDCQVYLDNNIYLKLGTHNIIDRLYFFITVYPFLLNKIHEKNKKIEYLDLRYRSGFVIKWVSSSSVIPTVYGNE